MNAKKSSKILVSYCLRYSRSFAFICGLVSLLAACSHRNSPDTAARTQIEISAVMPVQQTFYTEVAAIGQLAADSRSALSLSLPQAGQIIATDAIAGLHVRRDDVLLKLVTDPASRSAYLQARSAFTTAQADLARTERLHAEKLATNAQLDATRKTLADTRVVFNAQAALGGAQAVAELRAPADGVVTALPVQKGQHVSAGRTLMQFTPTAALAAQLGVEPEAAAEVRVGMPVSIRPVYGRGNAAPLHGTVAMVGDAVNPQTHRVDVVATFDGNAPLAAGSALSARIRTSGFRAWAVPRDTIQSDAQGDHVFQIEHGKAKRIAVQIVAPNGSPVGVKGALNPQAPVITLGSYEISDGDPVHALAPLGGAPQGTAAR